MSGQDAVCTCVECLLAAERAAHEATREEKDRLKALLDEGWKDGTALIARQSTEIERLREENARLRDMLDAERIIAEACGLITYEAMKATRAALAAGEGDGDA